MVHVPQNKGNVTPNSGVLFLDFCHGPHMLSAYETVAVCW